jgi:hypothetical protein
MAKLFGIMCMGLIGLLYGSVLLLIYLLGMCYLVITEILFTKKFNNKFKYLNTIMIDEFKDAVKSFKSVFGLV